MHHASNEYQLRLDVQRFLWAVYYINYIYGQSNRTPGCSQRVSAAGLPWLEHFRAQRYTWVKSLLVGLGIKSSLLRNYKT